MAIEKKEAHRQKGSLRKTGCFKEIQRNKGKKVHEVKKIMYEQNGNINEEAENIKWKQKEELKIAINETKSSLEGLNTKFDQADLIRFEDRTTENIMSEEEKEENWTESKGPVGHHQMSQYKQCGDPRRRERKGGRDIVWGKTDPKLPKFERHKCKHPRSSMNSKHDELKETQTKTRYNQTVKRQRKNVESSNREWLVTYKGSSFRNSGGQKAMGQCIQNAGRKNLSAVESNPLAGKPVLQSEGEIKTLPTHPHMPPKKTAEGVCFH